MSYYSDSNDYGPCPICADQFVIVVAGPDENGQYDTEDCPCQTDPDFDPANYLQEWEDQQCR